MKTFSIKVFAGLLLFTISCKKENTMFRKSSAVVENTAQTSLSEANELVGAQAVRIGKQVWKIRNLTTNHYRNGDHIPQVTNAKKWASLTSGAWCWYNNDSATYAATYGKLYNWYAVNDPRGLAPEGWHIPSDAEWATLTDYLGGALLAGGKMKSTGTIEAGNGLWHDPNKRATNSSGLTGLPGGVRDYNGFFYDDGYDGFWWSSTEYNSTSAQYLALSYDAGIVGRTEHYKPNGFSVRCVKD